MASFSVAMPDIVGLSHCVQSSLKFRPLEKIGGRVEHIPCFQGKRVAVIDNRGNSGQGSLEVSHVNASDVDVLSDC